jgi:hypothetical protein
MKHIAYVLIAWFALFSAADARDYFGIRIGFPEIGLQIGSTNLIARNLGGRLTIDFAYWRNGALVGGDILYTLNIPTPRSAIDFAVYFGLGVGVGFTNSAFDYNLHGVIGLEVLPIPDLGLFVEVRPIGLTTGGYYFGGSIGLNFQL